MSRTPIRAGLKAKSTLHPLVKDGLKAVERSHHDYIDEALRSAFADSLDMDKAFHEGHERENRWDYLLGHKASGTLVALEPHSATTKEVPVVIRKRERALEHIRPHLSSGVFVSAWFWVASGKVDFVPHEKAVTLLANAGITFVGKQLLGKRLGEVAARKKR